MKENFRSWPVNLGEESKRNNRQDLKKTTPVTPKKPRSVLLYHGRSKENRNKEPRQNQPTQELMTSQASIGRSRGSEASWMDLTLRITCRKGRWSMDRFHGILGFSWCSDQQMKLQHDLIDMDSDPRVRSSDHAGSFTSLWCTLIYPSKRKIGRAHV